MEGVSGAWLGRKSGMVIFALVWIASNRATIRSAISS
jgi:hypothetical protein